MALIKSIVIIALFTSWFPYKMSNLNVSQKEFEKQLLVNNSILPFFFIKEQLVETISIAKNLIKDRLKGPNQMSTNKTLTETLDDVCLNKLSKCTI